jgi:hypothetical protein
MIRIFQILAAILAGVAVFFWSKDNTDWAFASGVFAAASYLLSMRFQIKARILEADAERTNAEAATEEEPSVSDDQK